MRLAIGIALFILLITQASTTNAEEPRTISARLIIKELKEYEATPVTSPILALARICVNEEGWSSKRGCAAIWQVVKNVRSKTCNIKKIPNITQCRHGQETYLSTMRRLSKRVTGIVPATREHHKWTSTLQMNDDPPTKWVECKRIRKGKKVMFHPANCHGTWSLYVERWREARKFARGLYWGHIKITPCPKSNEVHGPVIAWGYEGDLWLAKKRKLIQVDCGDTNNMFFAKPKIKVPENVYGMLATQHPDPLQNNAPNKLYIRPRQRYDC